MNITLLNESIIDELSGLTGEENNYEWLPSSVY